MMVTKNKADIIYDAINTWQTNGLLNSTTANLLLNDIQITTFDWRKLAKYSMLTALVCFAISLMAAFSDLRLIKIINAIFNSSPSLKCLTLLLIAGAIFWFGYKRQQRWPEKTYSNEAIMFLGIMAIAGAFYQLGRALQLDPVQYLHLLFISSITYGAIAYYVKSSLIWIFALLVLGSWFGAETGYLSGWGAYYIGMSYPIRFVLFGGVLTGLALALKNMSYFQKLYKSTLVMGLLYLFIALWMLSIFGNYHDMLSWYAVKQIELFHWCLLFAIASGAAIYHGLRYDNNLTRGFGITFLFINLYTRYFEFFWDHTHKAIFFAGLAVTLWWLGVKAEKIWKFGKNN